jgi:hypothetical protein
MQVCRMAAFFADDGAGGLLKSPVFLFCAAEMCS